MIASAVDSNAAGILPTPDQIAETSDTVGATVGVAVGCPVCGSTSINLVTRPHVDVPFHSDARVGVVAHVFEADALRTIDEFRAELGSAAFDEKRLVLDG